MFDLVFECLFMFNLKRCWCDIGRFHRFILFLGAVMEEEMELRKFHCSVNQWCN